MVRLFRHYVPASQLVLILGDSLVIVAAVVAMQNWVGIWVGEGHVWPKAAAVSVLVVFSFRIADLYRPGVVARGPGLYLRVLLGCLSAAVLAAALGFAFPVLRFGRLAFLQIFGLAVFGLLCWRVSWAKASGTLRERVLVLGTRAASHILKLQGSGLHPFHVVGFLDDRPDAPEYLPAGAELLGKSRDLLSFVDELRPDVVLVALAEMRGYLPSTDLLTCRLRGLRVEDWFTFYEKRTGKVRVTDVRPSWLIFSDGFVQNSYTQAFKRLVDVVTAAALLLLSAPLAAVVAIAIKLDSPGPVLFSQERVGHDGKIFTLHKFRSMRVDAERESGATWATADDRRVTRVGHLLRKSRFDELPQLVNVLMGDMSLIGPRPERPEFVRRLERAIPFYRDRLSVKPGLTGWAQVRYAYASSVEDTREKLEYDLYYIKNVSPFLDLLILIATIQVVLFGRGSR